MYYTINTISGINKIKIKESLKIILSFQIISYSISNSINFILSENSRVKSFIVN